MRRPPLIFIQGPTSSGKTDLSIKLAQAIKADVVNCDSIQVYKGVNIGTAKPSGEELSKVSHHLLSFVSPPQDFTAGQYRKKALEVIEGFNKSLKPLIFVGGSGFYFKALEGGMFDVPPVSEEALSKVESIFDQGGVAALYKTLLGLDPEYAKKVYKQDGYRVKRALELIYSSNKTMTQFNLEHESLKETVRLKNPIYKIGHWLERKELEPLVRQRTLKMLDQGLLGEVENLVSEGLSGWAPMRSVGYKESQAYLQGLCTYEELIEEIIKNTLRLAKKQRTWFKKDDQINWCNPIEEKKKSWRNIIVNSELWLDRQRADL